MRIRDAGSVLRTILRIRMRDSGNVLRTIQRIRMRDAGGVLRTVFSYLSVVLNMSEIYGSGSGAAASGNVTTALVTGTVSGGVGPFTYLWVKRSGHSAIVANSPALNNTTFSVLPAFDGPAYVAEYVLRVTDSLGAVVESSVLYVEISWYDTR